MGITFLQPWAWLLAVTVALPIAVHLLARNRSRRMLFPTLRFLEVTKLSAVSRQTLQDVPLLAVRIALVLAAVAALAGPVLVTPARQAVWARRVARAVVLDDRTAPPEDELRSAAVGATFARMHLRDAVGDAVRWLGMQRPVAREIVVFSAFRRGTVSAGDLVGVPEDVSVRLIRSSDATSVREREIARLQLRDEGLVRVTERLTLGPTTTEVQEIRAERLDEPPITVRATSSEQPTADGALRAVLRRGLRLPPAGLLAPIAVEWPGDVTRLAAQLESRLSAPLEGWEPELMTDAELAALARQANMSGEPRPEDMGDRQTIWLLVLVLLSVEWWARGTR
jgi:Aerotolerance regulator N-terminal